MPEAFLWYLDSCFHRAQFSAKWGYFKVLQGVVVHAHRKRRFSLYARTLVYIRGDVNKLNLSRLLNSLRVSSFPTARCHFLLTMQHAIPQCFRSERKSRSFPSTLSLNSRCEISKQDGRVHKNHPCSRAIKLVSNSLSLDIFIVPPLIARVLWFKKYSIQFF